MSYETLTEKLTKGKDDKFFVSIVPVSVEGAVLLGRRTEDGIWTTPGGGAEPHESPEQAAKRELFEEAGLVAGSALELVNIGETPRGYKIFSYLWRMPRGAHELATSRLDPDKEVKTWKLYRPQEFPAAMTSEENASRLTTIREALMKFHGVSKSGAQILSLVDKLNKGGEGSGVKGHQTHHPEEAKKVQALIDLGFEAQDAGSDFDEKRYAHLPEELKRRIERIKEAADTFHETDEDDKGYAAAEHALGNVTLAYQNAAKKLVEKESKSTPSNAHAPVHSDPAKPVSKLQAHLDALQHGGVVPGVKTQSGKPVVTNMDQAKALGYDVQDHVDAMNTHYELAHKTQAQLDKLKMAGHKIPAEGAKIAQFHQKKMKEHMQSRQYLEERKTHTAEAIKVKKKTATEHAKKSITQMGAGLGDRDLDVGSFAQANGQGNAEWMERLYSGMEGYSFGDDPRSFETNAGTLHIAKVDDGLYTGFFTKKEEGLADNAKIRIERITIPELVQLMIAKEWIHNHMLDPEPAQAPIPEISLAEKLTSPFASDNNPIMIPKAQFDATEQRIRILELIGKLIG